MSNSTKNSNLSQAKKVKNDEFYTQYHDIEKEINAYLDFDADVFRGKTVLLPCDDPEWSNFTKYFAQNFSRLGLKKLISTSFAHNSKKVGFPYQPTLFEEESPDFDKQKSVQRGKIFTLTKPLNADGEVNLKDLKWKYLQGDGDFRSAEIKKLRAQADIIITNPPFSLFREFVAWLVEGNKKFAIIGSMNAITYKEIFPLIQNNKIWLGATGNGNDMVFAVPKGTEISENYRKKAEKLGYIGDFTRLGNSCWFTNLEHGRRHEPLILMTMADNLKYNKKLRNASHAYQQYDNYHAIEVPVISAIPSDYSGVMGVPISFLDKYNPEQFEIIGQTSSSDKSEAVEALRTDSKHRNRGIVKGDTREKYARILIKHKQPQGNDHENDI